MKAANTKKQGSAIVTLSDEGIIVCTLSGHITEDIVAVSIRKTKHFIDSLQAKHQPVRLALDISGVTTQTSHARSRAKRLAAVGIERIAVYGGSRTVTMVGQYIARAAGLSDITKFFRTREQAWQWLQSGTQRKDQQWVSVLLAMATFGIATTALIGWIIDEPVLRGFAPDFKPMNPVVALTLMGLSTVLFARSIGKRGHWWRYSCYLIALWMLFFGMSVLLNTGGIPWAIDAGLFSETLNDGLYPGRTAPLTAFSLVLFALMLLCATHRPIERWQQYLFHACSVFVFLSSSIIAVGYLFGVKPLYDFFSLIPMPLNTALCFVLLNHVVQTTTVPLPFFARSRKLVEKYWQSAVVFLSIVGLTGLSWQQSRADLENSIYTAHQKEINSTQTLINNRVTAYIDALHSYRAFFEASDQVDAAEYTAYFKNSLLAENYPGFTTISFIRHVPREQKETFVAEARRQTTADYPYYANYTLFPKSSEPILYPTLYYEPKTSTRGIGFDLSVNKTRRDTFERARDTGQPAASSEIDLNLSNPNATGKRPGFFISMPVYKTPTVPSTTAERRQQIYGYVNAVFEDKRLFADIFKGQNRKDLKYVIANDVTKDKIFSLNADLKQAPARPSLEHRLKVADQPWNVALYAPENFAASTSERNNPPRILFSGLILATVSSWLFISQVRRRTQALDLASDMTEDLSNERNSAVATQQKDEAILSSIGDAVFAVDIKGRITLFNPAAEAVSGFTAEEAIGKPYHTILNFAFEKDNSLNDSFIKEALGGKLSSMKNHTILLRKDGLRVPVADSAAPIRDARGNLQGAIVVFRDVSNERELDKAKDEFVSLASHQLRTPLSSISWYTEMLLSGDAGKLTAQQQEYLQEVHEGSGRMTELVNALLDTTRLEVGKLSDKPEPTDLGQLILDIQQELAGDIKKKKLKITNRIDKLAPVVADPKMLRMVVQNISSNAVKYTPNKGEISFELRHVTAQDMQTAHLTSHQPHFFFSVKDTGYGIPKSQQPKIFTKLFRADNVRALDVEGTGLGLYIIKEVVEKKFGGRVWFTSAESLGTTFYVIIPQRPKSKRK